MLNEINNQSLLFIKNSEIHEDKITHPLFNAIHYLKHYSPFDTTDQKIDDINKFSDKLMKDFEIFKPLSSILYRSDKDLDANYIEQSIDAKFSRNMEIRKMWWTINPEVTDKREQADRMFMEALSSITPIIPGTFQRQPVNETYQFLMYELWTMLTSQGFGEKILKYAENTKQTYEEAWVDCALSSLQFCLLVDKKQREQNGQFIPFDETLIQS